CQWGMSDKLGAVAFRRGEDHVFLGRELAQPQDFSESTAELIDNEIQRIITETERKVQEIMQKHRHKLEALAAALVEAETLEFDKIEEIFKHADASHQGAYSL